MMRNQPVLGNSRAYLITFLLIVPVILTGLWISLVRANGVINSSVIYVDATATGTNDGISWANAFDDLQLALTAAVSGTEIWVAEGVYRPAQTADVNATFQLVDGVALYGGFPAGGGSMVDRDPDAHPTILSGDIDDNDLAVPAYSPAAIIGANSERIVTSSGVSSSTVLDGFLISGGSSTFGDGGGVANINNSSLVMRNLVIMGNTASDGGGLYNDFSSPTLTNVVIEGNAATSRGGGIFNINNSNPSIEESTILRNSAEQDGGGIYVDNSSPLISNTIFNSNSAQHGGGMSTNDFSNPVLDTVLFMGNSASYGGGLNGSYSGTMIVHNSTFWRNTAEFSGGGVRATAATTLIDVEIVGNVADSGGGVSVEGDATLINTTIIGNVASWSGGGVAIVAGNPSFHNVTIVSNSAAGSFGGGGGGGGLYNQSSIAIDINNSVFWGNSAGAGSIAEQQFYNDVNQGSGSGYFRHSLIEGSGGSGGGWDSSLGTDGGGNLDAHPQFMRLPTPGPDEAWGTADDDYGDLRLQSSSPAVDAGDNFVVPTDSFDLDNDGIISETLPLDAAGNPRQVDITTAADSGSGTPPLVDIGALEAQPGLSIAKSVTPLMAVPGEPVVYRLSLYNGGPDTATGILVTDTLPAEFVLSTVASDIALTELASGETYVWQPAELPANATATITLTGQVSTSLTGGETLWNTAHVSTETFDPNANDNTATTPLYIERIIYVDESASGTNSGDSWADAFTDLQDALSAVGPGYQIWVAEGIYKPTSVVTDTGATFQLTDGMVLIGGFPDGGSGIDGRDPTAYPTILSGDIDDNDLSVPTLSVAGIVGNNALNVVTITDLSNDTPTEVAVRLDGFTVSGGSGSSRGGGLVAHDQNIQFDLSIENSTFSGNSAESGGGMYASGTVGLSNVTFVGNSAMGCCDATDGGGLAASGLIQLDRVSFTDNHADRYGGGTSVSGDTMLRDVTFLSNTAGGGGGMHASGGATALTNVNFFGNVAFDESSTTGGGGFHGGDTITMTNVSLVNNSAYNGGGAYFYGSPTLINAEFTSNSATNRGGALYNASDGLHLANSLLVANRAAEGGAIFNAYNSTMTLQQATLLHNSTSVNGVGIYNDSLSTLQIDNSILWHNETTAGMSAAQLFNESGAVSTIGYSLIEGSGGSGAGWDSSLGSDNGGNLDVDPQFVGDPDSGPDLQWGTADDDHGDLRLQISSPAVDAGDNFAVPTDTFDLDNDGIISETLPFDAAGNPRQVDITTAADTGNGTPPLVDIGAFETQPGLSVAKAVTPLTAVPGEPVVYRLSLYNGGPDTATGILVTDTLPADFVLSTVTSDIALTELASGETYVWQTADLPAGASATITLTGQVSTSLTGSETLWNTAHVSTEAFDPNAHDNTATIPLYIERIIYVDESASGANSGDSWVDAYTDLQVALSAAGSGSNIWVAEGIYKPTSVVTDMAATFALVDGAKLFGGFPTGGGVLADRDPTAFPTVLSGDIDNNDITVPAVSPYAIIGSNSLHVVTSDAVSSATSLDGFIISGGDGASTGGGLLNVNGSAVTLVSIIFSGNAATSGAGMYNDSGSPSLSEVVFKRNNATDTGGGLFNGTDGAPLLEGVSFLYNAAGSGGGMRDNGDARLSHVSYIGNRATGESGEGGGLLIGGGATVVHTAEFLQNEARNGGGVSISNGQPTLVNVSFVGNSALECGGAISTIGNPTFTNIAAVGNAASNGGGICNKGIDNPAATFTNVTLTGNWATGKGGGLYNLSSLPPIVTNSAISGNTAAIGSLAEQQLFNETSGASVISHSLIRGSGGSGGGWDLALGSDGGGNLDADPQFVRTPAPGPDSIWGTADDDHGDLRLQIASPAVDAGDNGAVPTDTLDLDGDGIFSETLPFDVAGNPRHVDIIAAPDIGNGSPPLVDIGAYEAQSGISVVASALPYRAVPGETVSFRLTLYNSGPDIATSIILTNTLPEAFSLFEIESTIEIANVVSGLVYVWQVADLIVGGSETVTLTGTLDGSLVGGETLLNLAEVRAHESDPTPSDNSDLATVFVSDIIYVDSRASGANDGSSWGNAFTDLQNALTAAAPGLSIWVAGGIHKPTSIVTDTTATFLLPSDVEIFGGYPSGGGTFADRDPSSHLSILSGDIDNNDLFVPAAIPEHVRGSNSRNIVTSDGVSAGTVLDGFTISGGSGATNGAGLLNTNSGILTVRNLVFSGNSAQHGGGLSNTSGQLIIESSTFDGNSAIGPEGITGGGVANSGEMLLVDVDFRNNWADYGGGMSNSGTADLIGVAFVDNRAAYSGGGLDHSSSGAITNLRNVLFAANKATGNGGGFANRYGGFPTLVNVVFHSNNATNGGGMSIGGSATLTNTTFYRNQATNLGGGIYDPASTALQIANTILWDNEAGSGSTARQQLHNIGVTPIGHSLIQGSGGSGVDWDSQLGVDQGGNLDANPLFLREPGTGADLIWGTLDDEPGDLRIRLDSPAVDAGDNDALPADALDLDNDGDFDEQMPVDINGNPRRADIATAPDVGSGSAPLVDIGAYETHPGISVMNVAVPNQVRPGETVRFRLELYNGGPTTATGIVLTNTLPASFTVEDISSDIVIIETTAGAEYAWSVADLPPDASGVITVTGTVTSSLSGGERLWSSAAVTSLEPDPNLTDNTSRVPLDIRRAVIAYVDKYATGDNDGSSWMNAFIDLQDALTTVNSGTEIWVATGSYTPTTNPTDTAATFQLVDGVAMYGGFPAGGSPFQDRDPAAYPTVLSGDIDENDLQVPADSADDIVGANSEHVVSADGVGEGTILDGITISGGSSTTQGGGVYNVNGSTLALNNVTVSGNAAVGNGGGLYNSSDSVIILASSMVFGNVASTVDTSGGGGGLSGGTATVAASTFANNHALGSAGSGGAVWATSGTFSNVTFESNHAEIAGGAMSLGDDTMLINVTLVGNSAADGGAVRISGSPVLDNVLFQDNIATGRGGAIYNTGSPTMTNVIVHENSASKGGGMYVANTFGSATVMNADFHSNAASESGGGIFVDGSSSVSLVNTTFVGNAASNGGGAYYEDGGAYLYSDVTNVSFISNEAFSRGGGIFSAKNSGGLQFNNSIFWSNEAGNGAIAEHQIYSAGAALPIISYSLVQGSGGSGVSWEASLGTDGGGNLDADPDLVQPPAPGPDLVWGTADDDVGDIRLRTSSPAVDAASNDELPPDSQDLDSDGDTSEPIPLDRAGNTRRIDLPATADTGLGEAPLVDMGAYETKLDLQIRVTRPDGSPAPDARVYYLPPGQTSAVAPIGGTAPLLTNAEGLLSLSGTYANGGGLQAAWPFTMTETYTGYLTSAPPTLTGIGWQIITNTEIVQQLVATDTNPLLVADLDISLEWDAREDTDLLTQLASDIKIASARLYDISNGQFALGNVRVFHDKENWLNADVIIFASNNLRPNADLGGSVITSTTALLLDGTEVENGYLPGQVRMPAVWNRYGDPSGVDGVDWPRALAHELAHYFLFVPDNYMGLDENGRLVPKDCVGSVMTDAYREDYSELLTAETWLGDCLTTVAHYSTGLSDWETVKRFYPFLNDLGGNSGPNALPLALTHVSFVDPEGAPDAFQNPFVSILDSEGSILPLPASGVEAFQIETNGSPSDPTDDRLIPIGAPRGAELLTRGAGSGDRVCVLDSSSGSRRSGCNDNLSVADQTVTLAAMPGWSPNISISPVITTGEIMTDAEPLPLINVVVTQTGVINDLYIQVFPTSPFTDTGIVIAPVVLLQPIGGDVYTATVELEDAVFEGYALIWEEGTERRDIVSFLFGGGWGPNKYGWGPNKYGWGPNKYGWGPNKYGWGGGRRGWSAPILSGNGQVTLFSIDHMYGDSPPYALQSLSSAPGVPSWLTPIGEAYQVGELEAISVTTNIQFSYLQKNVPTVESFESIRPPQIYHSFDGGASWQRLETAIDTTINQASAIMPGPGLYTLAMAFEVEALVAGWNNVAYPDVATRSLTEALASIEGAYSSVYLYEETSDDWLLYDATVAQPFSNTVNTLSEMVLDAYWIYATQPAIWYVPIDPPGANVNVVSDIALPPATYYGWITPTEGLTATVGSTVQAWINGDMCGESTVVELAGKLAYTLQVTAEPAQSGGSSYCGDLGRAVLFTVDSQTTAVAPTWENSRANFLSLEAGDPAASGPSLKLAGPWMTGPNESITLPIWYTHNGHAVSSLTFSIDLDETLLAFDPTDGNSDGVPDTVSLNLPFGFGASVTYDALDTDGELDIYIADAFPPLSALPEGTLLSLTLQAADVATSAAATVAFSHAPPALFKTIMDTSVLGATHDSFVVIPVGDVSAPTLTIGRVGSDARVTWPHDSRIGQYDVWRSPSPFFMPGDADATLLATLIVPPSENTITYTDLDATALDTSSYYLVHATNPASSALSNRVGKYSFESFPGYDVVSMAVMPDGVVNADTLAAYLGSSVTALLKHESDTQSFQTRVPGVFGTNFSVGVGDPVIVVLDDTAPTRLHLIGDVPNPDDFTFTLSPGDGNGVKYNFLSLPLHRSDIQQASDVFAEIAGTVSVLKLNAQTQAFQIYAPGFGTDFSIQPGEHFVVVSDETAPSEWP